jgi:NADPH2 dehydrogenase
VHTMATSKLFQPIQFGKVTLQHRVVMAPLTRNRGNNKHTPQISLLSTMPRVRAFPAH